VRNNEQDQKNPTSFSSFSILKKSAIMVRSKSFQLLLVVVLAVPGGLFVAFLLSDSSFWVPTFVAAGLPLIFLIAAVSWLGWIFDSGKEKKSSTILEYPTKLEYSIMLALVIVVCLVAVTALSVQPILPPWLLLPVWSIPALMIILVVFFSGLVLGLHREDGKVRFRSMKYKLELGCGLGFLGLTIFLLCRWFDREVSYPLSFDGRSDALQKTVVVPTLDTPIPKGKSVIWCASFQCSLGPPLQSPLLALHEKTGGEASILRHVGG
jgi:hypothetical protein